MARWVARRKPQQRRAGHSAEGHTFTPLRRDCTSDVRLIQRSAATMRRLGVPGTLRCAGGAGALLVEMLEQTKAERKDNLKFREELASRASQTELQPGKHITTTYVIHGPVTINNNPTVSASKSSGSPSSSASASTSSGADSSSASSDFPSASSSVGPTPSLPDDAAAQVQAPSDLSEELEYIGPVTINGLHGTSNFAGDNIAPAAGLPTAASTTTSKSDLSSPPPASALASPGSNSSSESPNSPSASSSVVGEESEDCGFSEEWLRGFQTVLELVYGPPRTGSPSGPADPKPTRGGAGGSGGASSTASSASRSQNKPVRGLPRAWR
ncbi:hypothetical protein B0H16DRAFT_1471187 [Mycena metata]|uniref:Uncharacterized protein n=1 Tax=Mycena metata TaxID=1033252 RepID=A0AAD7HTD1_9AGAR|nr:hypothetical protein B0H16DRAFT_1471187 [Mycena metata]